MLQLMKIDMGDRMTDLPTKQQLNNSTYICLTFYAKSKIIVSFIQMVLSIYKFIHLFEPKIYVWVCM